MANKSIARARLKVEQAEEALKAAKAAHELEFRKALVKLCNEYGLSIEASGDEGARLTINEIEHEFTLEMLDW